MTGGPGRTTMGSMTIREHAERTEKLLGHRAEDIHRWIDRYFDAEGFAEFLKSGYRPGYDPYAHRRHRHCREAVEEARAEFAGQYAPDVIEAVFERHVRDDYDGYFPYREDFETGTFREKYHEADGPPGRESASPDDLAAYFKGKHYEKMARAAQRRSTRFLWRFLLPVSAALLLLLGSLFAVIVPVSRENMLVLKKEMIRELTAVAAGALEHYAAHARRGELTPSDARREAAEEIRRMRYGPDGKEYYWIIDSETRMVMHPYRPELEGRDLSDYRDREDTDGVYLFREAVRVALEDGEGYIEYWWQHWDDPEAVAPKLSYVLLFPEWNWIVSTGVYIDDVHEQTRRLAQRLGLLFGGIDLVSIVLLTWVLAGALRVEKRRDEAETGLKEAKERYRALAEASAEGYMLLSGGSVLYANPAFCRLSGYDEEELLNSPPTVLLDEETDPDHPAGKALSGLTGGETPSGDWTVAVKRGDGSTVELNLGISRIFLPGSNGHILSLRRPVTAAERIGIAAASRTSGKDPVSGDGVAEAIRSSEDRAGALEAAGMLGDRLTDLMERGAGASALRDAVGAAYDALAARFAELAVKSAPEAALPGPFALISLGSAARREMTPFSDQDGALVFADPESPDAPSPDEIRGAFLTVAASVSDGLAAAGFPRCDGGVMPVNPRWCLSLSEWDDRIADWAERTTPQALLELNVVLDRRFCWGSEALYASWNGRLSDIVGRRPSLIARFRENATLYRPPSAGKAKNGKIDVKEALKPLEIHLRILALNHGIGAAGTLDRINSLRTAGVLSAASAADLGWAFETFWNLRFRKQLEAHRRPVRTDDAVDIGSLSVLERKNLSACLKAVDDFAKRRLMEDVLT